MQVPQELVDLLEEKISTKKYYLSIGVELNDTDYERGFIDAINKSIEIIKNTKLQIPVHTKIIEKVREVPIVNTSVRMCDYCGVLSNNRNSLTDKKCKYCFENDNNCNQFTINKKKQGA